MSQPRTDVAAAILAGGAATRMGGRFKALVQVDGARIVDRQLAVLRPRFASIAIVANDRSVYASLGLPVIADEVRGAGPIGGLAAALAWSPAPRTLVIACDMPYLEGAAIDALLAHAPAAAVVAPSLEGRAEPLHAVYATRALPQVRAHIAAERRKLASLLRALDATFVDARELSASLRFLTNVNREADLKKQLR